MSIDENINTMKIALITIDDNCDLDDDNGDDDFRYRNILKDDQSFVSLFL